MVIKKNLKSLKLILFDKLQNILLEHLNYAVFRNEPIYTVNDLAEIDSHNKREKTFYNGLVLSVVVKIFAHCYYLEKAKRLLTLLEKNGNVIDNYLKV